jgi:hypothetical protein
VFAVPRSTAMSRPRNASALLMWNETFPTRMLPVSCAYAPRLVSAICDCGAAYESFIDQGRAA